MFDEKEVIREVLAGRADAFEAIVRENQAHVIGLCLSMLGDPTEAEDAAQETFVKAFRSLRSFKMNSRLSTWLYRIGANHCKDVLRGRQRRKTQSLEAMVEEQGEVVYKNFKSRPESKNADIESLLSCLSEDERVILTLREAQGLSYQEIAETLDCTLDAVKARLRRARIALQQKAGERKGMG